MTRIGLIGSRGIAAAHARAAAESSGCAIVACAALHRNHAQRFADEWDIASAYDSIQGLLEGEQVDVVILATWPADHLEQVRLCCRYPIKGILCEKALAMNRDEGLEMQRVTVEAGVLLMEGLMYRHHPQIQEASRLIGAGRIGRIGYITGYFSDRIVGSPDPDNWRFKPALGGGTMTAKACYTIDCLSFLSGGQPESAIAYRTDAVDGACDVGHTALITFDNGVTATFEANHRTVWREEITAYGETGSLVIPHAVVTATTGIRCNTVAPGWTVTEMHFADAPDPVARKQELENLENEKALLGRLGRPEEIAAVIVFLLSDDASFVNATTVHVDGGTVAH